MSLHKPLVKKTISPFKMERRVLVLASLLTLVALSDVHSRPAESHEWRWTCDLCRAAVWTLDTALLLQSDEQAVASALSKLCIRLHIADSTVCTDTVQLFRHDVLTVLARSLLSPRSACGLLLGDSCGHWNGGASNWTVRFPGVPKPPVRPPVPPPPGTPVDRILFITDVHWDAAYKEGTNAECGEPLCCREGDGLPAPGAVGAGYWGDYRKCDVPMRTIESMLQHIATNATFDFVYWTGDIPAHNIWQQTRMDQLRALDKVTGLFWQHFGARVRVFPAVGNHESTPVNSFPPPFITGNLSSSWLYEEMASNWSRWLPNDALHTIRIGGFYTARVKPGLRVVSLNMNFCSAENFWLLINDTDPAGQLHWFIDVLQAAETAGEKVHVIGHIPPGLCRKTWSWNYYRIINRYESTIAGQFFGHVHTDKFEVFYDEQTLKRPLGIAFLAPSVTTFYDLNPGYRVYEVDGDRPDSSRMVLDHHTFFLNLSEANASGGKSQPTWRLLYSARKVLGLSNAFPQAWDDLVVRMQKDYSLFDLFWALLHTGHPPGLCRGGCRTALLCSLRTGRSGDPDLCAGLVPAEKFKLMSDLLLSQRLC
uniref:sphingomyelin phosphodiesterase isoform X2 n=1 Tax=Myxine glutinosa TaxID=7769 RepID=UPI00359018B4